MISPTQESLPSPEPLACALLIIAALAAAGVAHTLWLRSGAARAFRVPVDGGLQWRGRRLLGNHKTLAGFMALPPAAGLAFAALGWLRDALPPWLAAGLWPLTVWELLWVGAWLGFCFMAGELPNSFLKRRWDIAPGTAPMRGGKRTLCLFLDRIDSIVAMSLALAIVAPVPALTYLYVFLLGPGVHFSFSVLLWQARVKARPA